MSDEQRAGRLLVIEDAGRVRGAGGCNKSQSTYQARKRTLESGGRPSRSERKTSEAGTGAAMADGERRLPGEDDISQVGNTSTAGCGTLCCTHFGCSSQVLWRSWLVLRPLRLTEAVT
jgi:hypothetical protein